MNKINKRIQHIWRNLISSLLSLVYIGYNTEAQNLFPEEIKRIAFFGWCYIQWMHSHCWPLFPPRKKKKPANLRNCPIYYYYAIYYCYIHVLDWMQTVMQYYYIGKYKLDKISFTFHVFQDSKTYPISQYRYTQ